MKKFLLPLLLFFIFSCENDGKLIRQECKEGAVEECFISLNPALNGIGTCTSGTRTCAGGTWTKCFGEILPNPIDVCDPLMLDDDCDGFPNQSINQQMPFAEFGRPCGPENVGECRSGTFTECKDGKLICEGFVDAKKFDECDGLDNDCDGEIDELEIGTTLIPCYEFGLGLEDPTLKEGLCSPGLRTCRNGVLTSCLGQVRPTIEICNTKDDNCNGEVDENQDTSKTDVIFIVDVSGSFAQQRNIAFQAILDSIQQPDFQDYQFSLINTGIYPPSAENRTWRIENQLLPPDMFIETISRFFPELPPNYSGQIEPYKDVVWSIIQEDGPIEWREDSLRFIIMLGNEAPQHEVLPHTDEEIRNIIILENYFIFIMNETRYYNLFQTMLDCDGLLIEDCPRYTGSLSSIEEIRDTIINALYAVCF